ncbi:MAG: DUF4350 domain-containing protein [Acidobacteria bacterium]|nr:DUF4350 domain-containing protein [Acidobacteriota bacterium]
MTTRRGFAIAVAGAAAFGQQRADEAFEPEVRRVHASGGPAVHVDQAHNNFHTISGRYRPFAKVLEKAGFQPKAFDHKFSRESLAGVRTLVIANALSDRNKSDWTLPTPTAFTLAEVSAAHDWVERGGRLLLIVDHMPFPGCNADLGKAFGLTFSNGYARDPDFQGAIVFSKAKGTLKDHAITRGIDEVATFTGSAFRAPEGADAILVFGPKSECALVTTAGEIRKDTPREPVGGWLQGAVLTVGKGRVAVFGEAAMFSAQTSGGGQPMGMNSPLASQNAAFLVNVIEWLTS